MRNFIPLIVFVFLGSQLFAQDLPSLPADPNIVTGSLPSGVKYYVIKNTSVAGQANYALIQKEPISIEKSREALVSLPHFRDVNPYKFLTRRGVGYKEWGYIDRSYDATFYRFEDLPTADAAVNDSTLMMIFDLCQLSPYEQAVIVSGDVNPATVVDRMGVFSMMLSPRKPFKAPERTTAEIQEPFRVEAIYEPSANPCKISLEIKSARTPSGLMGTVMPHMTQYFIYELGVALENRISKEFYKEGIPLPRINFDFTGSADSDREDRFVLNLYVEPDYLPRATAILSQTVSSIDSHGLPADEYRFVKQKALMENPAIQVGKPISNDRYIDRCASAYLRGASLAAPSAVRDFFATKNMDPAVESNLFNSFATAFISPDKNMLLSYETSMDNLNASVLESIFRAEWKNIEDNDGLMHISYRDTSRFVLPVSKVKLKAEAVEPATGGKMWTFSNGIKVIYKKVPGSGSFDFSLLLKGGYASIPNLGDGQGPYMTDMLRISNVAGMTANDFHSLIEACGIKLKYDVATADMRIYGSAPSNQLSFALGILAAYAGKRGDNAAACDYFLKSESQRLTIEQKEEAGYMAMADSIMRPGYKFTPYKYIYGLDNSIQKKAAAFFESQFLKINDGYFIFMGDIKEDDLLSLLTKKLGNFCTSSVFSSKPSAKYMLTAGETSIMDEGEEGERMQLNISQSCLASVSAERYFAFEIACLALQRGMSRNLGQTGMFAEVKGDFEIYPAERLRVTVRCQPSDLDGLPAGVNPNEGWKVLRETRKALSTVCATPVSAADLAVYKKLLTARMAAKMNTPEAISDLVVLRYSSNRDFITKYAEKIAAVSAQNVQDVLSQLAEGCKVEYTVK